jgi:hypothetical protein
MGKYYYIAKDQNRNQVGKGTVEAKDEAHAMEAVYHDARSKDLPTYDFTIGEEKSA